jgi:predicted O-methyltransferase YrrM
VRKRLKKLIPRSFLTLRSKIELYRIDRVTCDSDRLATVRQINLDAVLNSDVYHQEFEVIEKDIALLSIPDDAGGVNPGDQRAIYSLVRHLQPRSVLEVGTHIGASAICIASALRTLQSMDAETESRCRLVTVDNRDVNDPISKPWRKFGAQYAPIEMLKRMGCDDFVRFVCSDSLDFFSKDQQKFDLIFLDGSHASSIVYQEIPAAVRLLQPDGYILLHDYFPDLRPLWSNSAVVPGPYLATRRLEEEGADIKILPIGELPWRTKLGSHVTSLALLGKKALVLIAPALERIL